MWRACTIVGGFRSSMFYRHIRDTQSILRQRIREISETKVKRTYGRIHVLLRCEGWLNNDKRMNRLHCLQGLQLRYKVPTVCEGWPRASRLRPSV